MNHSESVARGQAQPDEVRKVRRACGYTQVDNGIFQAGLSCRAIGLYTLMWSKPPGWRFSSRRLAAEVCEGREALRTAMKELITAGFVLNEQHRDAEGRIFTVFYVRESLSIGWDQETPGGTEAQETGAGSPGAGNLGAIEKTERAIPDGVSNDLAHPADERLFPVEPSFDPTPPQPPSDRFDEFWELYPRRIGKRAAQEEWVRALKRGSADAILAGLRQRATWWSRDRTPKAMIPHPATWLHADRWLDEVEELRPRRGGGAANAAAAADDQVRDSVERAIEAHDGRLAWRLMCDAAAARGERWIRDVAEAYDEGMAVHLIEHVSKHSSGRALTADDVAEVVRMRDDLFARAAPHAALERTNR